MPPDVGLAPSAAWRTLPVHLCEPPPPRQPRSPIPEHCKKSQGGGEGREVGREGLWLEGRVLQLPRGWGVPSKRQLGPDPHPGALKVAVVALLRAPKQTSFHFGYARRVFVELIVQSAVACPSSVGVIGLGGPS